MNLGIFPAQVYMAKWCETLVAVKLLLNTGVSLDTDDMQAAADLALSLSHPNLHNLHTVRALSMLCMVCGGASPCPAWPSTCHPGASCAAHLAWNSFLECGCAQHGAYYR